MTARQAHCPTAPSFLSPTRTHCPIRCTRKIFRTKEAAISTSLCRSPSAVGILAITEAAVLAAAIVLYVSFTRAQKAMKAAENAELDEAEERRKAAEKAQTAEDKKIVDNAFSDTDDE